MVGAATRQLLLHWNGVQKRAHRGYFQPQKSTILVRLRFPSFPGCYDISPSCAKNLILFVFTQYHNGATIGVVLKINQHCWRMPKKVARAMYKNNSKG